MSHLALDHPSWGALSVTSTSLVNAFPGDAVGTIGGTKQAELVQHAAKNKSCNVLPT